MEYFELLNAFPVLARLIAMIPGAIVPILMTLAGCLCVFAFVDGALDRSG